MGNVEVLANITPLYIISDNKIPNQQLTMRRNQLNSASFRRYPLPPHPPIPPHPPQEPGHDVSGILERINQITCTIHSEGCILWLWWKMRTWRCPGNTSNAHTYILLMFPLSGVGRGLGWLGGRARVARHLHAESDEKCVSGHPWLRVSLFFFFNYIYRADTWGRSQRYRGFIVGDVSATSVSGTEGYWSTGQSLDIVPPSIFSAFFLPQIYRITLLRY